VISIRQEYVMKTNRHRSFLFAVFALLFSVPLHVYAQCASFAPEGWPTEVAFEPASPTAGEPVDIVLGPLDSVWVDPWSVSANGNDIYFDGEFHSNDIVTPPPPEMSIHPLGSYPAGTYDVHIRLHRADGTPCPEVAAVLVVGGGSGGSSVGVPASGLVALTCLVLGLCAFGEMNRRRLRNRCRVRP
jgi:hypothetical protein